MAAESRIWIPLTIGCYLDGAEVSKHWRNYQDTDRDKLDYDIDGLVIRINDMAKQMALGDKDLRPKGAIAFKFDNEARESIIKDIIWQVGNSGRLTPVAVVDPVDPGRCYRYPS